MTDYNMDEKQIIQDILDNIMLTIYIKEHVLIHKPSCISDNNNLKYFKINLSSIRCGLTHHITNYKTLIRYCYHNNLKLIKPKFILLGKHNNGKDVISNLSKYYDLDNIKVNDTIFNLYNDRDNLNYTVKNKVYKNGIIINNAYFKPLPKYRHHINGNYKGKVEIPYNTNILTIAKLIADKLGKYVCIHVRKGDRIQNKKMIKDTSCKNIMKIINTYSPKKVYIMTNKITKLKSLDSVENVFFYKDFTWLNMIKDNYYLYCIEKCIMRFATIRCSTFNVKLLNKHNTYYHCYLTNYPGWQ